MSATTRPEDTQGFLLEALTRRLEAPALEWLRGACREVAGGVDDGRFCALLSTASRHARGALEPSDEERAVAAERVSGWNPERWERLDAARAALVLAHPALGAAEGARVVEEAFRFADVGELCALHRSLHLVPEPARFAWRGGEGCRSNMNAVFEAVACDGPFPLLAFDQATWNQMCIKALFIGAPLWRVHGLDQRLEPELARMALDLADERRAASRTVHPELWLCLGEHGGERGCASLEREFEPENPHSAGRRAAALALVRAGEDQRLRARLEGERDPAVAAAMRAALAERPGPADFAALHGA